MGSNRRSFTRSSDRIFRFSGYNIWPNYAPLSLDELVSEIKNAN
jgi:hypothetical protein